MINILLSHILTKTELSSAELKTISDSFIEIAVKKREFLLKPGKVSQYEYFIAKGCIRSFVIDEKGIIEDVILKVKTKAHAEQILG